MDFYIEVEMTRPKIPGQRRRIIGINVRSDPRH